MCFFFLRPILEARAESGTDFLIDGRRIGLFGGARITTGWLELGTQITPQGWIFWTMIFYNLKKFTSISI